ncbi:MAG: zinc ribbon domain-containing protein [Bacteroidaceae bacterium]|nr:zinc ribbon domain-containing protein [Bacteroidaceae bacterium]
MFCPECGRKIEDAAELFCSECGTPLERDDAPQFEEEMSKSEAFAHGILLTDAHLLAQKLGVDEEDVTELLQDYVALKKEVGISYTLIDMSRYATQTHRVFGISSSSQRGGRRSAEDCLNILKDVIREEDEAGRPQSTYLFIIGSDDVVPMPCITHFKNGGNYHDKDIDTDLPYAYPYADMTLKKVELQLVFDYEPLLCVGRLPVGNDTTLDDIADYFQRSLDNATGIPMEEAYAQCDPHWKKVSARVAEMGLLHPHLRNFDGRIKDEFYFNRLMLTPYVDAGNVEQIFPRDASLYYYNLHGSSGREQAGYSGEYPPHRRQYATGLLPEHMAQCTRPNIVIAESCYGARHINLDAAHSMLLSAIYSKSLLYVGSSRIAWGELDPSGSSEVASMDFADVIAFSFINILMQGYSAGVALDAARCKAYEYCTPSEERAATIAEFNLFGDPSLSVASTLSEDCNSKTAIDLQTTYKSVRKTATVETLYSNDGAGKRSILQMVRGFVDRNLEEIERTVGDALYSQYGLPPRKADAIYRITAADGSKTLKIDYNETAPEGDLLQYSALTREDGTLLRVITTK